MPATPHRLAIGAASIADVRHLFPNVGGGSTGRRRRIIDLLGIAVHHDGVIMAPGDRNYDGVTLDEDLGRLQAIYQRGLDMGWGGFPYHLVVSPNGRVFYTQDIMHFGAHVARRNHQLVGVAFMGNFMTSRPGDPHICAGGLAIVALWHLCGRLLDFRGHREWALPGEGTECPGDTWWTWQRDLLQAAALQGRLAFPRA